MHGLLIVDKPAGPTSHDVVERMRRALRETRIGHTGTLDPLATGVLLLVIGKATRLAKFLSASDKSYEAVVRLGFATDTGDAQGQPITAVSDRAVPSREVIDAALDAFRGTFLQQPPAYSAKKIDGQRSYALARARAAGHLRRTLRRGRESISVSAAGDPQDPQEGGTQKMKMTPDPCRVTSYAVSIVSVDGDRVTLSVDCSAGFYIRSLAHDLGERLGVGAHLAALRRTRIGGFGIEQAVSLDAVERDPDGIVSALTPLAGMLPGVPSATLTAEGVDRAVHGRDLGPGDLYGESSPQSLKPFADLVCQPLVKLLDGAGELVAIARPSATGGLLHPSVVLV